MLILLLTACLNDAAFTEPGWQPVQRDPVNPVLATPYGSPSIVRYEDGVSGVFTDPSTDGAVRDESGTGWAWGTPALVADDVLSVSHLEAPQGTLLFAERPDGLFRGDPAPGGVDWTALDLDGHAPDVLRTGAAWWLAVHRDDGIHLSRSDDGFSWSGSEAPSFTASADVAWMSDAAEEPALVAAPDGRWYLLVTGTDSAGERCIGAAVANELVADPRRATWLPSPDPLLCARTGFEGADVGEPDAIVWNDVFHIWYTGFTTDGEPHIGHAGADWPLWTPEG